MNIRARAFRFGPFYFDTAQQELRRHTRRVRLSVSLLKLLTLFLERHGQLVTREEIAFVLWEDSGAVDIVTGINTAIRRLRAQLDDDPSAPTYIETVIGIGYRFIAHVEEMAEAGDTSVPSAYSTATLHIQQPAVIEPPATDANVGASTTHPIDALPDVEQSTSIEPQPAISAGAHRFLPIALVSGVALHLLLLGAVLMGRNGKLSVATKQKSTVSPSLVQVTFNNEENKVTTEAISPKGDLIAYADHFGVSVHALDGGADRLLSSPSSFLVKRISWHPAQDWVLVSGFNAASHRSEAWAVFLHGEASRLLLDDAGMAVVSPDGSQIAYTRAENSELWLANGIGQNAHLLIPRADGEKLVSLLWSPQGDRLIDARVRNTNLPEPGSSGPTSTPPRSTYESLDVHSGKLLSKQENVRFNSGFLLKDGRFFFPAIGDFLRTQLMMVNTDPGTGKFLSDPQPVSPTQAPYVGGDTTMLSASANGDRIGAVLTSHVSDVYVAEVQWPGPTLERVARLTDGSTNYYPASWTPNGDSVLFDRNNFAPLIGKQRLGDSKMEIVAQLPNTAAMAAFSPDGKWILFTEFAGSPSRAVGIYTVPSTGGKPRRLHTTGVIDEFHCPVSSRGSCVMRETIGKKEFVFFALDPIHGMQQEVGRAPWSPTELGDWSVSPDGSTVAMANHDAEKPGIQLIPLSPNRSLPSAIQVSGFGEVREATWSPDAKGFFVETKTTTGYNLAYVDLAGRVKLLRQSQIAIWAIPSRDGKKLAFPGLTVASNVWAGRTALP